MNVCKWCMSGSATENSILLCVLPRLNKIFNQSINHYTYMCSIRSIRIGDISYTALLELY